jgi:hypothetical protein
VCVCGGGGCDEEGVGGRGEERGKADHSMRRAPRTVSGGRRVRQHRGESGAVEKVPGHKRQRETAVHNRVGWHTGKCAGVQVHTWRHTGGRFKGGLSRRTADTKSVHWDRSEGGGGGGRGGGVQGTAPPLRPFSSARARRTAAIPHNHTHTLLRLLPRLRLQRPTAVGHVGQVHDHTLGQPGTHTQ